MRSLILFLIPVAIVGAILGFASVKGGSFLKKQGVAWAITAVMIVAAVGIGYAKSPANAPVREPEPGLQQGPGTAPGSTEAPLNSFVWDNARVLSDKTVRTLDQRNERLWDNYSVTIGVVTCDYGGDDLYSYAMQCADDMSLGGYDMIVVLDISGDNYWLLQGNDIRGDFTDDDCSDYAYDYMETWFAAGDYDFAVEQLTEMLELWYGNYYG